MGVVIIMLPDCLCYRQQYIFKAIKYTHSVLYLWQIFVWQKLVTISSAGLVYWRWTENQGFIVIANPNRNCTVLTLFTAIKCDFILIWCLINVLGNNWGKTNSQKTAIFTLSLVKSELFVFIFKNCTNNVSFWFWRSACELCRRQH